MTRDDLLQAPAGTIVHLECPGGVPFPRMQMHSGRILMPLDPQEEIFGRAEEIPDDFNIFTEPEWDLEQARRALVK